jgi:type VII secretion protein EccB
MPMQSRSDQVHSYEFFLQRVVSGLVARESDPAELPFRRLGWSGFGSIMVTVVVAAVFGIIGVLRGGGNTTWQEDESIIRDKGSGTIYLYIGDKLHPMANLVSAQLATGGAEVVQVSARSLEGVPRGVTLGIPGAPHALPDGDDLLTASWSLCSQERDNERGEPETISVLGVGTSPVGGQPVGERAVLVRDRAAETYHMVWRGYRFALSSQVDATVGALGTSESRALPVSPAWLDGVPEGEPLAPPSAGEPDQPTTAVDDPDVATGDVIQDGDRFYLVRSDDLVEMTELQAQIVLRASGKQEISARVPTNAETVELGRPNETTPPESAPEFVAGDVLSSSVCSVFPAGRFDPVVIAGGELDWQAANETVRVGENQNALVDYVNVPGGAAVLVQSIPAPDAPGGQWHIVNDQGTRFSLPDESVAGMLGYDSGQQGVQMSGGLVGLLARGPDLDPAVAGPPRPEGAP